MYFKLPPQLLENTLNYLASKPWVESHLLIDGLSNLPMEKDDAENATKTGKEKKDEKHI